MADPARRGFRLDRPPAGAALEAHARSFLTGFNLALAHQRDVHEALTTVAGPERGFAYEGAGMCARLLDIGTAGLAGALPRLLDGPGRRYVHLVHVGAGWGLTPARIPIPVRLPRTPLLRWLAVDGAGFGETYFGGLPALRRRTRRQPSPPGPQRWQSPQRWQTRISGCGRALWFVEAADPDGVAGRIAEQPPPAQPWLWSGVGLAAGYAGAIDADGLHRLAGLAADAFPYFAQGVVFAAAARVISGVVPEHTELACRIVLGVEPDAARQWSDEAAGGLTNSSEVAAYAEWRARLRRRLAPN